MENAVPQIRRLVWVDRFEDLGLLVVISTSLVCLGMGLVALVDGLISGFTATIIALAQPAQWMLPLAGIGLLLQVVPRALITVRPTRDRGPWRVKWSAVFFTILVAVFFTAGWIALFNSAFSASLYTSAGNLIFYWCLATVAGGLATLAWTSIGLFTPRDRGSWTDLDLDEEDDPWAGGSG